MTVTRAVGLGIARNDSRAAVRGADEMRGANQLSHVFLGERVRPGDRVVDATCGNGRDTLLLARLVGPGGKVWGFDIQDEALAATSGLLERHGVRDRVELVAAGHELLAEFVSVPFRAMVFNLGYLPGGDRGVTTRADVTLAALTQGAVLLEPGGVILVVFYTGHPGGAEEAAAVEAWASGLDPRAFHVWRCSQLNRSAAAPYLLVAEKARGQESGPL